MQLLLKLRSLSEGKNYDTRHLLVENSWSNTWPLVLEGLFVKDSTHFYKTLNKSRR